MKTAMIALGLLLAVAQPALAKEKASWLEQYDTDGDGYVSRDEFAAAAKRLFDRIDQDHSGHVTKARLRSFAMRQMFSGDRDPLFAPPQGGGRPPFPDGDIDWPSFKRIIVDGRFAALDADHDGRLSAAELTSGR